MRVTFDCDVFRCFVGISGVGCAIFLGKSRVSASESRERVSVCSGNLSFFEIFGKSGRWVLLLVFGGKVLQNGAWKAKKW